jgi:membrane-associated protease RseP (regulator of RpoE activity)
MTIFILLLLFTIIIHELGHLISALLCGIKVKAFSVGFFKPYLQVKWKGIEWRLTPWVLGGYCELVGELERKENGFLIQSYWKKVIVVLAGVFMNLLVAFVCYLINYGSIRIGLMIDWEALKMFFTKDSTVLIGYLMQYEPNFILLQLSMLNLACVVTNLIPFPALDGSFVFLLLMEKVWKENFEKY